MVEPKVNLSFTVQGRVLLSEQECSKNPRENYNYYSQTVYDENGKNPEVINFTTRKCNQVRQSLNICKEAYLKMIDKKSKPEGFKGAPSKWSSMTKEQRLEYHLKKITESLGGKTFTYQVFED